MEIKEIKERLRIEEVLEKYGLSMNKNKMIHCPFHDDKTPSMQVYPETDSLYCFSSNCEHGGKKMDVIDFIMYMEKCTKSEAINKAKGMIGEIPQKKEKAKASKTDPNQLEIIFPELQKNLANSKKAQDYLESRNIPYDTKQEIGFRNTKAQIKGMSNCLIFPLKDETSKIVSFYGRSITSKNHYYSEGRKGLYPYYLPKDTKTVVLTESIIDAVTIKRNTSYEVLALYGTNGFTAEHLKSLQSCRELEEVILFMDGDAAGEAAVKKYATTLRDTLEVKISEVITPEGEDPNSLLDSHEPSVLAHLINDRQSVTERTSSERTANDNLSVAKRSESVKDRSEEPADRKRLEANNIAAEDVQSEEIPLRKPSTSEESEEVRLRKPSANEESEENPLRNFVEAKNLVVENPEYLTYQSGNLSIAILGGISLHPIDKLKVTIKIHRIDSRNPLHQIRHNLDLYYEDQVEKLSRKAAEKLEISSKELLAILNVLTELLENYRLEQKEKLKPKKIEVRKVEGKRFSQAIKFLQSKDLLKKTNDLIGKTGMIGEETNRLLMYLVFTSRLRKHPLHIVSLGASGTGKTYLQEKIAELIPEDQKLEITAMSENALYYFQKTELQHKLVLIEDLDGANDDKVLYAIRELQSKKRISKTVPIKDSKGNMQTQKLEVEGPISLAGTTTKEKLYEDNANRSLLIYLDNSKQHKENIMDYQRKLSAGQIDEEKEATVKEFFKDIQSILEPIQVRNPYATQLKIPESVFKPLRSNAHYLNFIEVITFYHQFQRAKKEDPKTGKKYIETTLEDIQQANHLLKDVLLAKSDELTKSCRDFFERLKVWVQGEDKLSFYTKEVRTAFKMSPSALNRHLIALVKYDYLKIIAGSRAKGFEYEITNRGEYDKLRKHVNNALDQAFGQLKIAS